MNDLGQTPPVVKEMACEAPRMARLVGFVEDRWIIETRHRARAWEVIVEPDRERQLLVVVTAYPVWE
jgi:hypothetical protein